MNDRDKTALVVVDMQNYYIKTDSPFHRYFSSLMPGCMDYISRRCSEIVLPRIIILLEHFREKGLPVLYLRLCGRKHDRSDLHHLFRNSHNRALAGGYADLYPLWNDPFADVVDTIPPAEGDIVIDKTTFSPFTYTDVDGILEKAHIGTLVFTGLATSQCVETTARDASERGYRIVHVEDAQADYDEFTHHSSLISSQGVCGGNVFTAEEFISSGSGGHFL